MSREYGTEYQALRSPDEDEEENGDDRDGLPPDNVMTQIRPDQNRSQWNHIEDLDEFFSQCYQYYQRNGFMYMVLEDFLLILQFVFITLFGSFLFTCVNFQLLVFDNSNHTVVHIFDAIYPPDTWVDHLHISVELCLIAATFFFAFRILQFLSNVRKYHRMKCFYESAMNLTRDEMHNRTWHEVLRRLLEVQKELQMCIHKSELTELDIYHRMLRFKNYMVAMVNKNKLSLSLKVPCLGEIIPTYLSTGLRFNLEMILFWGPGSPFKHNWELKADYKSIHKRKEVANQLSRRILYLGIANLILSPVILTWTIFYSVFRYLEKFKRDPATLGMRLWSPYARLFLRHFNELDHEFDARLNRAHHASKKYMTSFSTPVITLLAKHCAFFCGSVLAVILLLTLISEVALHISHILVMATALSAIVLICQACIPDENLVFMPEHLMRVILSQIHYVPDSWKGNAHTTRVRDEFAQLFQYQVVWLVHEIISAIVTPYVLMFQIRYDSEKIVEFFRNYTIEVTGVGDVCSFAQMDIRRHGHPEWAVKMQPNEHEREVPRSRYDQAELGKTELSLMHFTMTNPEWRPPATENEYMSMMRSHAQRAVSTTNVMPGDNPLLMSSSNSLSMFGGHGYNSMLSTFHPSLLPGQMSQGPQQSVYSSAAHHQGVSSYRSDNDRILNMEPLASPPLPSLIRGGGMRNLDLPIGASGGFFPSMQQSPPFATPPEVGPHSAGGRPVGVNESVLEYLAMEMSFGALYMHDHHHDLKRSRAQSGNSEDEVARRMWLSADTPTGQQPLTLFTLESECDPNALPNVTYASQAPAPRMPNIQESSEGEEELNNRSGGPSKMETDYLLSAPK